MMSLGHRPEFIKSEALYRQVHRWLAQLISDGTLPPGFRLPPTREMALDLGVARNVVIAAYEELEAEGRISSHVGRGTYVR